MNKQYKLVRCNINGKDVEQIVDVRASLTDMLRNDFRLTSVKKGCEVGECGACNVIIDGECFNSCIYLAVWAEGKHIRTLGLHRRGRHPVRLLHAGLHHDGRRAARDRPGVHGRRAAQAALRPPVPLHRL